MPPTTPNNSDIGWTEPSPDWERLTDAAREQILKDLNDIGFNTIKDNWQSLEAFFADEEGIKNGAALALEYNAVFMMLSERPDLLANGSKFFPMLGRLYNEWMDFLTYVQKTNKERASDPSGDAAGRSIQDYLEAFSNGGATKFTWAGDFMTTQKYVSDWLQRNQRAETEAPITLPYQLRLGGSRFFVPPINIQVNTSYRSGGLTGAAIRQAASPKFNSGHSDTVISMTLYFPNQESIWGFSGTEKDIDFDKDPDDVIDRFMSSLRGLIAQFRYSPILPLRNDYLNRTYGITAVALQGMSVQTIPNYPFCVAVNLELLNFNHKVFLPMINDFNQAVLWGRFRQYMGRAAEKMNSYTNEGFLMETVQTDGTSILDYEGEPTDTFNKMKDMGGVENIGFFGPRAGYSGTNPNKFSIYYPARTPAKVFAPDTAGWEQPGENTSVNSDESIWGDFLGLLGYDPAGNPEAIYEYLKKYDQSSSTQIGGSVRIQNLIVDYLYQLGLTVDTMTDEQMDQWLDQQIEERRLQFHGAYSQGQEDEDRAAYKEEWFFYMFTNHTQGPLYKQYQEKQESKKKVLIKEWDVPMERLDIDWKKVIVNGVSVSLGNNFARHQLQMQAEPSLQHIGGRDSTCSVSMTIFGEEELIRLKRVFDHITGLARLEHSHGVLGFLGIKNVLTGLCGMKYVIPLSFQIDTIPNVPHVYSVQLDMVDFDVFQQKREELSSEQQAEFIEAFGKRNPFLRIKQLWSAFNAYPDFPLAIYDDVPEQTFTDYNGKVTKTGGAKKAGKRKLIGHLDPDFYFRAFQTIDDDLVNQKLEQRPTRIGDLAVYDATQRKVLPDPSQQKDLDPLQDRNRPTHPSAVDSDLQENTDNGPLSSISETFYRSMQLDMKVTFPVMGENQDMMSGASIRQGDVGLGEIDMATGKLNVNTPDPNNPMAGYGTVREDHAAQSVTTATSDGLTPHSQWGQPTLTADGKTNGANDPMYQVEKMMEDNQYRDNSGRMIRAYPTYMLWLIDEGGTFAGVKLFDNFYGLQSVIDFSVHQSEDVLGDTLVLRLSNLYSKLNSQYSNLAYVGEDGERTKLAPSITDILADPNNADEAIDKMIITKLAQGQENLRSGTQDGYIRELGGIRLKPGIRVHLRMGYSANPNSLDTVFNGTITQVTNGDIVEVIAQGDGIELAPYINAQPLTSEVLTPTGFKQMGEIREGDLVIGSDGLPTKVEGVSKRWKRDVYLVEFNDGSVAECCDQHLWEVKASSNWGGESRVLPLSKIREKLVYESKGKKHWKYSIPLPGAIEFDEGYLPLDPYAVGLLLGDGGLTQDTMRFTSADIELVESLQAVLPDGIYVDKIPDSQYDYRLTSRVRRTPNKLKAVLSDLGMLKLGPQKFVPDLYKHASSKTRLAVLQGLLDTDATPNHSGVHFSSSSFQLATDVQWLARSLGGFSSMKSFEYPVTLPYGVSAVARGWDVYLRLPNNMDHFRLERKKNKFPRAIRPVSKKIVSVEWDREDIVQCISVSAEDGLYITDDFIVTHNTTDKGGHSGKIDGALNTGLWLSEPRDLMVRLLSMGSSTFRESFAHATEGMIFSENKFGIRHFGSILYEEITEGEKTRQQTQQDNIETAISSSDAQGATGSGLAATGRVTKNSFDNTAGGDASARAGVAGLMTQLWTNSFKHRDYEIFKRNIYPGNGSGVAQYLGGDFPEAGILIAEAAGGDGGASGVFAAPDSTTFRSGVAADRGKAAQVPATTDTQAADQEEDSFLETAGDVSNVVPPVAFVNGAVASADLFKKVFNGDLNQNPIFTALGITSETENDLMGFDEVSFRAQTYMKSVWDMFKLSAQLLPNYIVAVRPFEDRSTVFYGKPHWLYTSGLIPITTGVPRDDNGIKPIAPNDEQQKLLQKIRNEANPLADFQAQQKLFTSLDAVTQADPTASTAGIANSGGTAVQVTGDTVKDQIWNAMSAAGYSAEAIAAAMGNMFYESSFNPEAENTGSKAYGLVQWYDGRRTKLENFARDRGKQISDVGVQLELMLIELKEAYYNPVESALRDPNASLRDKTWQWLKIMEAPGNEESLISDRLNKANEILGEFAGKTPTAGAQTTDIPDPTEESSQGGDVVTTDEEIDRLVKAGFPAQTADWFARGHLDKDVNIWSVTNSYDDYVSNQASLEVRKAAELDPVGHYARLMYDREYVLSYNKLIEQAVGDDRGVLGEDSARPFMNVFKDLGSLDEPDAGFSDNPTRPAGEVLKLAELIWDEFRGDWGMREDDRDEVKATIDRSGWKDAKDYVFNDKSEQDNNYILSNSEYIETAGQDNSPDDNLVSIWTDAGLGGEVIDANGFDYLPNQLVATFKKFMWQNPYARAWLVVTTDFHTSVLPSDSFLAGIAEPITDAVGAASNLPTPMSLFAFGKLDDLLEAANSDQLIDWVQSPVIGAWLEFLNITYEYAYPNGAKEEAIPLTEAEKEQYLNEFAVPYLREGISIEEVKALVDFQDFLNSKQKYRDVAFNSDWTKITERNSDGSPDELGVKLLKWLRMNDEAGEKSTDPGDRLLNDVADLYDGTIGKLLEVAGNTLQGLVTMMREQLTQLGLGLNMVGQMQQQAQIMNHIFNDSIYYAEGNYLPDGKPDLFKMVDNPFTREYGEPVIEVREPFQRLHYIDSFRHIISNGIQENLSGVPTVVTASSDGKYPVSVYFDKGIASHLQNEIAIETGLFWDNAGGEGFFSFLHPLINPIETMRGRSKIAQGSSDELLSKRVATAALKEGLKDIYQGEIVILGNADIRPHDLVYLADVYERVYGLFEVEAVTHHFTAETGFITAITPNALVSANDPARWAITKWIATLFGAKNLRDDTRHHLSVFADDTSIVKNSDHVMVSDLAMALQHPILGHTSYDSSPSAIIKDLVAAKATGLYITEAERMAHLQNLYDSGKSQDQSATGEIGTIGDIAGNPNGTEMLAAMGQNGPPGISLMTEFAWDAWKWVKENTMDQHACYISYLTKDGQAMDAGLSYAQGVAVGRFHTINILPDILGVQTTYKENGNVRILTNDLLRSLGWNEIDTALAYKQTSLWVAETNADILSAAGKSPDGNLLSDNHLVSLCQVTEIEDGDTIHVKVLEGDLLTPNGALDARFTKPEDKGTISLRLTGTRVFETLDHDNLEQNPVTDEGRRATEYLMRMLPIGSHVAVRNNRDRPQDDFGRSLSVVFHTVPFGTPDENVDAVLMGNAGRVRTGVDGVWGPAGIPGAPWDGYLDDGQPYTINWHMIMAGYGDVDLFTLGQNDTDRGVVFGQ